VTLATAHEANCSNGMNGRANIVAYMVPQAPTAAAEAQTASPARRIHAPVQPRWPLFLSIFGALAASVVLWIAIIWGVSLTIGWVNGAS
jgi:hypothetical protein